MSVRDLLVLGTAGAVPTKTRNHNGYLLRWDGHGLLFDPGEGIQRQMTLAGVSVTALTWICLTHFHGDHCMVVPGVVQRISRDGVEHEVNAVFPASGAEYWRRLRYTVPFYDTGDIRERPLTGDTVQVDTGPAPFTLTARRLDHSIEAYGYRLSEPDGVRMLPGELAARGVRGPLVGVLRNEGEVTASDGRTVSLEDVSVRRPGQKVAFVMDTGLCPAVYDLARDVDLLIIESTFLDEDVRLAEERKHLTAGQAGEVAAACRVRHLVLTHFSERYRAEDEHLFGEQAATRFGGEITVARDLDRIPMPRRRPAPVAEAR
jgi:ribonuclease Z